MEEGCGGWGVSRKRGQGRWAARAGGASASSSLRVPMEQNGEMMSDQIAILMAGRVQSEEERRALPVKGNRQTIVETVLPGMGFPHVLCTVQ